MSYKYAEGTEVPVERSRYEIEVLLKRFGAAQFAYASDENRAVLYCRLGERMLKFEIPTVKAADVERASEARMRQEKLIPPAIEKEERSPLASSLAHRQGQARDGQLGVVDGRARVSRGNSPT